MKQETKSIVTALLLGVLCAVTLSAVITVPDWETARADLLIGMQYETTGLDLDAVPGWLAALVMLHQNFPLDGWAWGPAAAGLAVLLVALAVACWYFFTHFSLGGGNGAGGALPVSGSTSISTSASSGEPASVPGTDASVSPPAGDGGSGTPDAGGASSTPQSSGNTGVVHPFG